MLVVKMMSSEDLPDSNTSKQFDLIVSDHIVSCIRDDEGKASIVTLSKDGSEQEYPMKGNAYVMQNGKTIASYAHMQSCDHVAGLNPE